MRFPLQKHLHKPQLSSHCYPDPHLAARHVVHATMQGVWGRHRQALHGRQCRLLSRRLLVRLHHLQGRGGWCPGLDHLIPLDHLIAATEQAV